MFNFIKKILGLPTEEEKLAAKQNQEAPYKIEPPTLEVAEEKPVQEAKVKKPRKPKAISQAKKPVDKTKTEAKSAPAVMKSRKPRQPKN